MEALAAQGLPEWPVGTLDELKAANLPPKMFPSCSEPAADGTSIGCPFWYECTMSYKGLPADEGGGPRNHCWERIKGAEAGGGVVRNSQPCYWGISQQENALANGEVFRPIKDEGEEYEWLTFIAVPKPSDPTNRQQERVKFTVPPFQRLKDNKSTQAQVLRAEIMKQEQERIRNEQAARRLGLEGGVSHINKRSAGSVEGSGETGKGKR